MITEREKHIWRAALTLAHNLVVQTSNSINDDDGPLEVVNALTNEAKRIRGWLEPTEEQLAEMFEEAKRVRGWLEPTEEQLAEMFEEAGVPC